jgi:Undecaprenyl-phosphate glucose phosphotransferase
VASDAGALQSAVTMGRRPLPLSQGIFAGVVASCDVAATALCAFVVRAFYLDGAAGRLAADMAAVALAALLLTLAAHAAGLYRFTAIIRPARHAGRLATVCCAVFLVMSALGFALKVSSDFSRVWAFGWMIGTVLLVLGFRFLVAGSLQRFARAGRIGRKIVVYGAASQGERLVQRIQRLDEPWNRIVGLFDDRRSRVAPMVCGYPVLGGLVDLVEWGRRHRPDEILIALPWGAEGRILEVLQALAVLPANVRLSGEFQRLDMIQGRTNYQFGVPMLNAFEKPLEGWGRVWKRLFDLALSGAVILICLPLMAMIAILIRLETPGPALFRQPRYGFNSKLIEVLKFRTMGAAAADTLGNRLTERNDSRITRVGAVLRRFSLDELPQLLNVLRGEMSLVGPRPHAIRTTAGDRQCVEVVNQYAVRYKVKPGITGWAQVNGWRGTMQTEDELVKRVEHDLYYINNWSPWLDLKIVAMTARSVLWGRNSY